ncbi:cell division protein FtsZ [Mycoplasma tullyi]|uniref:Cell division protein FtsZ n=1 Tax=Mycoplasma tullyi TaxID=1612150 RepID=A0A7D7Y491_9MOLU|nr:cell division protein FtsZ [Mycoplasma tullyi]QMT98237.1 cell division protein FtsZ [Mycoplasma tullyi]
MFDQRDKKPDISLEAMQEELIKLQKEMQAELMKDSSVINQIKLGYFDDQDVVNKQPVIKKDLVPQEKIKYFVSKYKKNYKIKIIGIGGAGNNIVEDIIRQYPDLVSENLIFYQLNTDCKHLNQLAQGRSKAIRYLIDSPYTFGNGAGGDVEKARLAISQYFDSELDEILTDCDICIVIAGLGKGTGSAGSTYIINKAASKKIITLAYVVIPPNTEGSISYEKATDALYDLLKNANAISQLRMDDINKNLNYLSVVNRNQEISNNIGLSIKTIVNLINEQTIHNLDYADLITFFTKKDQLAYEFLVKEIKLSSSQENLVAQKLLSDDWLDANQLIVIYQLSKQLPGRLYDELNARIKASVNKNAHIVFGSKYIEGDENIITILGKKTSSLIHAKNPLALESFNLIDRSDEQIKNDLSNDYLRNNSKLLEQKLAVINQEPPEYTFRATNRVNGKIETSSILSLLDDEE